MTTRKHSKIDDFLEVAKFAHKKSSDSRVPSTPQASLQCCRSSFPQATKGLSPGSQWVRGQSQTIAASVSEESGSLSLVKAWDSSLSCAQLAGMTASRGCSWLCLARQPIQFEGTSLYCLFLPYCPLLFLLASNHQSSKVQVTCHTLPEPLSNDHRPKQSLPSLKH